MTRHDRADKVLAGLALAGLALSPSGIWREQTLESAVPPTPCGGSNG